MDDEQLIKIPSIAQCIHILGQYYPVKACNSYSELQRLIPCTLPRISGLEFKQASPFCDFLSCFSTRDLSILNSLINRREASIDSSHPYLLTLKNALNIFNNMPLLQCVSDHMWIELDSEPNPAISFFLGSDSKVQTLNDKVYMFELCHQFQNNLRSISGWPQIECGPYFDRLLSFLGDLSIFSATEIGFMGRANTEQHTKILLKPTKSTNISEILDICFSLKNLTSAEALKISRIKDLFSLSPVDSTIGLSLALYSNKTLASIEIVPVYREKDQAQYIEFWDLAKNLFTYELATCSAKDVIWSTQHNELKLISKLHHLKFSASSSDAMNVKFYRDLHFNRITP